jgi:hypothetical protein
MLQSLCCKGMEDAISIDQIIDYDSILRAYVIDIDEKSVRLLYYCPWCGTKLPKRLYKEFYSTLAQECGLTTETLKFDLSNAPKEFQTDKWWKKRGL